MNKNSKSRSNKRHSVMVRSEWRHLFKSKILLLSLAVIMFIPIMYGGFFLGSIWDPYGRTGELPVAFVNQDQGATLQGKAINIGNDVTKSLKENHDIGWDFVSKDAASKGVDEGHYYAVVTIPKDFSRHTASITNAEPEQATIEYTLTPAKNYIGSLVSTQAAEKVKSNVSEQIVKAYAKGIFDNIDVLGSGLDQAADGAKEIASGAGRARSGIYSYTQGVHTIATNQQSLTSGLSQLQSGAKQLQSGLAQTDTALPTNAQIAQMVAGIQQLQGGLAQLDGGLQHPSSEMIKQQETVAQDGKNLQASLSALQKSAPAAQAVLQAASIEAATSGTATLQLNDVKSLGLFAQDTSKVSSDAVALLQNLNTLNSMLAVQQTALKEGVTNLSTGATTLASPLEKSLYGYNTLRAANTQLYAGSQTLSDGLSRALNGSQQLAVGANTLNANSSALNSGAVQLENGTVLLTNKLADAATKVKLQPTGEATQSQLASPVTSRESKKGDVPNYGYALAPYVLSLGLFVGALVFNVIYPIRKTFSEQENAFRWWLAKASIAGVAAFVQATILMLVMVFILGLQPDHPLQFSLAIYLTSFVYMSIVSLLVIMLDNVGRFLSMVLLVLQLGASEGTFPIQTAPAFFQAINPFLPMTYSIHTLRESISGGLSTQFYASSMIVLLIILFIANGLLIAFFMHRGRRSFAHTSVDGDN